MKNFRIAVTLSLIVTTTMQSMVGIAAAAQCPDLRCAETTAKAFVCDGCDRCPVAIEDELCCCCKPKPSGEKQDCPHKSQPFGDEQSEQQVTATLGICLCGLTSPPIDRGHERSRITEQIDQQDCDSTAICVVPIRPPRLVGLPLHASLEIGPLPRFSQRLLCVWQI